MRRTAMLAGVLMVAGMMGCGWKTEPAETMPMVVEVARTPVPLPPTAALRWKVGEGEAGVIGFKTSIQPVDASKASKFPLDVDALASKASAEGEVPEMKAFSELKMSTEASMVTVMKRIGAGRLSVKMIVGQVEMPETGANVQESAETKAMREQMKALEGTVQLRGEIDEAGKALSFYMATGHRNLLTLLFGLPGKPVSVGDEWSLDVDLIVLGSEFICAEASKVDRVKLVGLEMREDGEQVALIDYYIVERVKGEVVSPGDLFGMGEGKQPLDMTAFFMGRGEFSVTKGQWRRLGGRMPIKSTGMMELDTNQEMVLEPMKEIPEKVLKAE